LLSKHSNSQKNFPAIHPEQQQPHNEQEHGAVKQGPVWFAKDSKKPSPEVRG
jgi:hypothetical protein